VEFACPLFVLRENRGRVPRYPLPLFRMHVCFRLTSVYPLFSVSTTTLFLLLASHHLLFTQIMESRNKNVKKSPPELPDDVRRDEMDLIFHQCRKDQWKSVLDAVKKKPHVGLGQMVMDNHISTTIMHQAITSKGDLDLRAKVILKILEVTPAAAHMRNGYGSLPLHVIAQRNTKIKSGVKDTLIRALVAANVDAITNEGGPGKRTPLHIIFTGKSTTRRR
jgi:hypothetical protein